MWAAEGLADDLLKHAGNVIPKRGFTDVLVHASKDSFKVLHNGMSLRNKVPSNPLTKAEMKQLADELREFGVFVQYGKKYEDGKDILRFMPVGPGRAQLDLPANATWYEALHEAGHFRDWIARGKPSRADWLKIPYHEREKAVYDWIKANWWDDLTPDQQSDAFLQWMVEYQKFLRGE